MDQKGLSLIIAIKAGAKVHKKQLSENKIRYLFCRSSCFLFKRNQGRSQDLHLERGLPLHRCLAGCYRPRDQWAGERW